jgi:uncharacterized protein (DUF58 family)
MKIVPSARLIWIVAAVGFPASVAGALYPGARIAAAVAIAGVTLVAFLDALLRGRTFAGIHVELPDLARLIQDRIATIRVRIHNPRTEALRIRIGLAAPEGVEADWEDQLVILPAGAAAADISWPCTPRRRGRYRLNAVYLEANSPLGLWAVRRRDSTPCELRVYPNLRRDAALRALRRGTDGQHVMRQIGRGREFEKLREYVPGDGSDEIHWKATARRGRPITKVFQVERTQEVYVVIDASRLAARPVEEETVLDRAIKAALVVGAAAERRGDLFGLAAFSTQVEAFVPARAGKTHYAACRDAINELRPRPVSPDFDEIATFLRLRLNRRALILFLTSLDDPILAEQFTRATRLLSRRHLVMAGMLRPPSARPLFSEAPHSQAEIQTVRPGSQVESTEDIYRHLAGHLSWRKLRELEGTLGRQGIRLALLEPDSFSGSLIKLYDEVKQRQLL